MKNPAHCIFSCMLSALISIFAIPMTSRIDQLFARQQSISHKRAGEHHISGKTQTQAGPSDRKKIGRKYEPVVDLGRIYITPPAKGSTQSVGAPKSRAERDLQHLSQERLLIQQTLKRLEERLAKKRKKKHPRIRRPSV